MNTLDDAWKWYEDTHRGLDLVRRLAGVHWGFWEPESRIGRDDLFRNVKPNLLAGEMESAAQHLEDFAVFVLFSVFEAEVRNRVLDDTAGERASVTHPSLAYWMKQAEQALSEGSFYRVLDGFKSPALNDLVEQVNQVRRYRNWVAHGRREKPEAEVAPAEAYRRLRNFLDVLNSPPPAA